MDLTNQHPRAAFIRALRLALVAVLVAMAAAVAMLLLFTAPAAGSSTDLSFSHPLEDAWVSGEVVLSVEASSNITNVTFYQRSTGGWGLIGPGVPMGNGRFNATWDTSMYSDGTYELMANGTLQAGGFVTDDVSNIRVDNVVPEVVFHRPRSNQRLKGVFTIQLTASSDVTSLALYLDMGSGFSFLGSCTCGQGTNWTFLWNTAGISNKEDITIVAVAMDRAGNEGRTSVLGLEVDNVPPSVQLLSPSDNATLDGHVLLAGNTSEPHMDHAVFEWRVGSGVWLTAGDAEWNATAGVWTYLWNTYEEGEWTNVQVRFSVADDLGLWGYGTASNITITDLPPEPTILSPAPGAHVKGDVDIEVASQADTAKVELYFLKDSMWVRIGLATRSTSLWTLTWSTGATSLYSTAIMAVATDGGGHDGDAVVEGLEVDNTPPAPQILKPDENDYRIFGSYKLVATSDRDTVSLVFQYQDGDEWHDCGEAGYNPNNDRWELVWAITVRVVDSAICATAEDEVGHVGSKWIANIEIGLEPGDRPPKFKTSMPEVIYFDEDRDYILDLFPYVDDDDMERLKAYVTNEPPWLFKVDGENVSGRLSLRFYPMPNRFGQVNVKLHLVDPAGQTAATNLSVFIRSVPDAPYFKSTPPNLFVHPDIPYEFDYTPYIEDVDTPREDLKVLLPEDVHVMRNDSNPLSLIFVYGEADLGKTFPVMITIMDPEQTFINRSIIVTVTSNYVPEQRRPLPDLYMEEDASLPSAFNLDDYFFDPDHDTLYFSYGNNYVRVVIGSGYPHTVGIFLPADWSGMDTVTFRATDPTGALLEDTIIIYVNATNDPPMLRKDMSLPKLHIRVNSAYDFDLSPYVYDPDDELADLVLTTNDPFATRSTKFTLGLRLTYPSVREVNVAFTVQDPNGGVLDRTLTVIVSENFVPVLRSPPSDIVLEEGVSRDHFFDVTSAYDADWDFEPGGWQDLTYLFLFGSEFSDFISFRLDKSTGWVDVILHDEDWSTYQNGTDDRPVLIVLRVVDDKGAFSEYSFHLSVLDIDDPPVLNDIPDIVMRAGIQTIDLRNYVRDVDTPFAALEFKIVYELTPAAIVTNARVAGELLVLDYTQSKARTDCYILYIRDGSHEVSDKITVKVEIPEEEIVGVPVWVIAVVAIAVGSISIYAARFVWGRFEPPSVSDVFLVYGDGVIIRHLSKRNSISMDEDLAIAMLTAIQEFVQQSMRSAQLKSMQAGDNNILIERDPNRLFYIAVIHTGTVSEELRRAINMATRSIRDGYADTLKKWDGNLARFDGVERFLQPVLAITHAQIPEGVRFEMEGITSIQPGKTFLFQGKDVARTHNIFRSMVDEQGSGLLISRVHPQRLHPSIPEAGAECVWLSKTPTKRGVSPSNTTMILHEITTYVRENPRTVVCLDGLEYLLVHNPLDEVVAFVSELTDMVQVDDFIMMIHVDPYALDDATLAKLSRNMVPVSDRRSENSGH